MHPNSLYGRRATAAGLKPEETSILGLCCVEHGLPYNSSFLDLAAKKLGLASVSLEQAEEALGKNWTSTICK